MSAPTVERRANLVPEHAQREHDPIFERESWALVARVQAGKVTDPRPGQSPLTRDAQDAYSQLWVRYYRSVFVFLRFRMRNDEQTVEQIASETFERGLRRIDTARWIGKTVGAWFITIARNLMLDYFKRASTMYEIPCSDMLDAHDEYAEPFYDPEQRVIQQDSVGQAIAALKTLTPQQREVLYHRVLCDRSVEETRQIMGGDTGRIKAIQHRAVVSMRRLVPEAVR